MQTYLVIANFHRRINKRGDEYGMPVSVMLPPEAIWGYDIITSAYNEKPVESWQRITERVHECFPEADKDAIIKLIGKKPE